MVTRRTFVLLVALAIAGASTSPVEANTSGKVETSVVGNPLIVELNVQPSSFGAGRFTTARARVFNLGTTDLVNTTVRLRVDESGLEPINGAEFAVGVLPGGHSRVVRWRLCGSSPGSYIVLAQARGDSTVLETSYSAESDGRIVIVAPGRAQAC